MQAFQIWQVSDGRVTVTRGTLPSEAEALESVGLRE